MSAHLLYRTFDFRMTLMEDDNEAVEQACELRVRYIMVRRNAGSHDEPPADDDCEIYGATLICGSESADVTDIIDDTMARAIKERILK